MANGPVVAIPAVGVKATPEPASCIASKAGRKIAALAAHAAANKVQRNGRLAR